MTQKVMNRIRLTNRAIGQSEVESWEDERSMVWDIDKGGYESWEASGNGEEAWCVLPVVICK